MLYSLNAKKGSGIHRERATVRGLLLSQCEQPQVVNRHVQPIIGQTEVYSGCYGRITVTFYGYNSNGNRGTVR